MLKLDQMQRNLISEELERTAAGNGYYLWSLIDAKKLVVQLADKECVQRWIDGNNTASDYHCLQRIAIDIREGGKIGKIRKAIKAAAFRLCNLTGVNQSSWREFAITSAAIIGCFACVALAATVITLVCAVTMGAF